MDYTKYEELVRDIAMQIEKIYGGNVEKLKCGSKNKITGLSGINHQIDVSIQYFTKDGKPVLRLFECKLRGKDPVGLWEIMTFYARIIDIQKRDPNVNVMGNFFTPIGYTAGAKRFAEFYTIEINVADKSGETWIFTFDGNAIILVPTAEQPQSSDPASVKVI